MMIIRTATCFAFAAVCLTAIATMPAANADVQSRWSARQNVIHSRHYDRLLETNGAFRKARMRKECGPIHDRQLHADCLASFRQDEPFVGSSNPRRRYSSEAGR